MSASTDSLAPLADLIGPANVLAAPDDIAPYAVDWRGSYRGTPDAVLRPGTTQEVSGVVRYCADSGLAIVPAGGRTGLSGGAVPAANGPRSVVLSLERLNRIRDLDARDFSLVAEAGCVVAVAAGNDAKDACLFSPSSARRVITVGASDSVADDFAAYSNFGSCVEMVAPGSFATGASFTSDRGSRTMSGTSMSTPLVAGAAAVALAQHPDADSRDVTLLLPCIASRVVNGAPHGTTNRLLFVPGNGFPEPSTASSSDTNGTDTGPGQACSSGTSAASAAASSGRVAAAVIAVAAAVAAGRCGRGGGL